MARPKRAGITVAAAAGLAALALTAAGSAGAATGATHGAAHARTAAACHAWTGHHPPYAVEISGVAVLSPCDIWATGIPGQNPTPADPTDLLHWNGAKWSLITSAAVPASLTDLPGITATSASDVWVAGAVVDSSQQQLTLIGHWDGSAFTRVPSPDPAAAPNGNELNGVSARSQANAWAVGRYSYYDPETELGWTHPLAEHWDGQSWTQVPAALPETIDGPTTYAEFRAVTTRCGCATWAVGDYDTQTARNGAEQVTLIERWTGSAWALVPSPNLRVPDQLSAVSADSVADAWAVGWHGTKQGTSQTLLEHWNGHGWTVMAGPAGVLEGVAAIGPSDAWAAGYDISKTNGKQQSLLLHWNGKSWTQVAVPHFGPSYAPNLLLAVSASSARDVIVAGFYSGVVGLGQQALVLRFG